MSIFVGANELTPLDRIYVGATEVKSVYVGATEVWAKYELWQVAPLSAADEAVWDVTGSGVLTRVNSDNEFRLVSSVSGSAWIDLWNYVSSGTAVNLEINVVSVDTGDSINIGLDSSRGFGTFTQQFPGSPYTSADTGVKTLSGQTIDSTKRYLKIWSGSGDAINFNDVILQIA